MKNKFLRQLIMLQQVPRGPRKITTKMLMEILRTEGFGITQRTIQRDLKELAKVLPGLRVDGEKDFPGWYWSREAELRDIPVMDGTMALTFALAEQFLKSMFPPSILEHLAPYFSSANGVLEIIDNSGYRQWQENVRILPRTQPLVPAKIKDEVITVIYQSLFEEKQFRGRYIKRSGDEVEYVLHPLGLIFRESVVYLVATVWDYDDPRHFALHRFKGCEPLNEASSRPDNFNLDAYLAAGSFEYCETENKMIRLQAIFYDGAGLHLMETPLSDDQKIVGVDEGLQVEASVKDSAQLRWWLLGFGDKVEVVGPEGLRGEFARIAGELAEIYSAKR